MPKCAILSCQKEHKNGFLCDTCFERYMQCDDCANMHEYTAEKNKTNKTKEPLPVAIKQDKGKPRHSLIRPEFLQGLSQSLAYDASKGVEIFDKFYAFDSLQNHLIFWLAGEDLDPKSNLPHLDRAASFLMQIRLYRPNQKIFSGLPYSLIRPEFLDGLAQCLTFGAAKYDDHNYAKGFDWSRLYDALQRHLTAWLAGEDVDTESGLSHLDHAASCLMMLRYHTANNVGKDDRLKKVA